MSNSSHSARPVIEALENRIAPATFTVTTTADSGPGSLRQAILDANALEGADTIGFDIPGDELQVIQLLSALPAITAKVEITVVSATGTSEKVELNGAQAGENVHGLVLQGTTDSIINGLTITHFSGDGVQIVDGQGTKINGTISSNSGNGIHIIGGTGNILGAQIGNTTPAITVTGNRLSGILIENSGRNTVGETPMFNFSTRKVYANTNGLYGIEIRGGGENLVQDSSIDANGTRFDETGIGGGIAIIDSGGNRLGGDQLWFYPPPYYSQHFDIPNSITDNVGVGILIKGAASTDTLLFNNTVSGTKSGDGIRIDGAQKTTFGGLFSLDTSGGYFVGMMGNTVSDNDGWGIAVVNGAANTLIRTTSIEDNAAGGVLLDHVSTATVGGLKVYYASNGSPTSHEGNAFHTGSKAAIVVKESSGVAIISNSYEGTGIPIDLGGDGVTPNDPGDVDTGANHLQNSPTLTIFNGQLSGVLATDAANTQFRIQIYALDPTTNRTTLIDTREVTTGSISIASFGSVVTPTENQKYTATATNITTGETSEFSLAVAVPPRASIDSSASIVEGNSGAQHLSFTVSLSSANTVPVKVGYRTSDNTAKAGEDYGAMEGFVVFEPGETTKTITVPVLGEALKEASETFYLDLTTVEAGTLGVSRSTVTIINDDALPSISIQDSVAFEGATGTHQVTLTLSEPSLDPVTVWLKENGGTAVSGNDYSTIPQDQLITFAPGTTSVTVPISIIDDSGRESDETVFLQLSNPTAGTLGDPDGVITIVDNDTWKIEAGAVQLVEGNEGQSMAAITVRLVNSFEVTAHEHPITVNFATQNGAAVAGSDYVATQGSLSFAPGEFEKTISIPIVGDSTPEQLETFSVLFNNPTGATLQQSSQTVTILNDDPGTISVSSASIVEGHSGQKMLAFNVEMSLALASSVSVNFETLNGTAVAGSDFEAVLGTLTFAPGETKKTVSVPILGDRIAEDTETFTLKLTSATGATITTSTGIGTIIDDAPKIIIENAQFLEGESPTGAPRSVFIPVRLSPATDIPVSVDFSTSNGTAEAVSDYIATSGTLTFAPGQTVQYIELQIIGDQVFEVDETLTLTLANSQGAEIGQATGTVTIKADEPFILVQGADVVEGNSGSRTLVFTVALPQPLTSAVTVDYTTADGTATVGSDYAAVSGTLTFAPGELVKQIWVPILGETIAEADEFLKMVLSNAVGANLNGAEALGTILDDDSLESKPVLTISDASAGQGINHASESGFVGPTSLVFTFSLSHPSSSPVTVHFATADGTADSEGKYMPRPGGGTWILEVPDYVPKSGTLTFAPGETSKTVSVTVPDETIPSANTRGNDGSGVETVRLLLSDVNGAYLDREEATGYVIDSLPWPKLTASQALGSSLEGGPGVEFSFHLSESVSWPVRVDYFTTDRPLDNFSVATAGTDYVAISSFVIIEPGETQKSVFIPIIDDDIVEPKESVAIQFSTPAAAIIPDIYYPLYNQKGWIGSLIVDDEAPNLTVTSPVIIEGHSGTKTMEFTLALSKASTSPVSLEYATANNTATAGSDYTAVSGTLTFAPGETSKTISVLVQGDTLEEGNEVLGLRISNVTGANAATIAPADTLVYYWATIADDDSPSAPPVLSMSNPSILEGHSGTKSLVFTASLSKASSASVSVQYATADGTATAGSDYTTASGTLTFAPGETSKTISVPVLGDTLEEANETLRLLLSNVTGATTTQSEATGFILDDDSASLPDLPKLTITGGSVREGGSGSNSLVFTVNLSAPAAWPVSVNYQHAGGSASIDFNSLGLSGTLTFAPGETNKTILVPVLGDYSVEGDQTVLLQISDPVGATLSTSSEPTATGTILDDDLTPGAAGLVISKGGRKATWTDSDGQHVILKATKPILTASAFHFSSAPDGSGSPVLSQLDLSSASPQGSVGLNFSVKERGGQVHIGEINAAGRDLGTVNLPGRLGAIFAGDTHLKTAAIGKLSVDSFGPDYTGGQSGASPTQSTVQGSIGSLVVKHGWIDAQLFVNDGSIGSAHIGGGLLGSSSNAASLLSVEKNIGSLQVSGNVMYTSVLAGTGTEAGAKVGNVQVKGDWIASNLVVGAEAGDDGLYGTEDDTALQDTASRIAKLTIRGAISGTADTERATDHFGIVAGRIAALQVGGQKLSLSAKWKDSMELGSTADLMLRELAGTARS